MAEKAGRVELSVNFDPALIALLREVRYFMLLPDLPSPIPAPAIKARPASADVAALPLLGHHPVPVEIKLAMRDCERL